MDYTIEIQRGAPVTVDRATAERVMAQLFGQLKRADVECLLRRYEDKPYPAEMADYIAGNLFEQIVYADEQFFELEERSIELLYEEYKGEARDQA